MGRSVSEELAIGGAGPLDVGEVYEAEAEFAWRSLQRLGIDERDLPDLLQEVFVVVHRQRSRYDRTRPLRAWLFGICVGLARNHRRRAFRRQETLTATPPEGAGGGPDEVLEAARQRARGERVLADLDPEHRAVFVMFEVEGMSGKAIAELLDVPIGTVHSRLHHARRALLAALAEGEES